MRKAFTASQTRPFVAAMFDIRDGWACGAGVLRNTVDGI